MPQQREHPEHAVVGAQRHQQGRAHGEPAVQRRAVRRQVRRPVRGTDLRHLGHQPGTAGAQHLAHGRRLGVHTGQCRLDVGVDGRDPLGAQPAVAVGVQHAAQVGEPRVHHQVGQPVHARGGVGLARQPGAEPGEQGLPFGLPVARVDVGAGADPALARPDGHRPLEHPPVHPVGPAEPELDLPAVVRGGDRLLVALPVLRVQPRLPVGAGSAGELPPAGVREHAVTVRTGHPDQGGREVGHGGEPGLGLASRAPQLQVRADAGEQLLGREGLHEVVVRAGREALDRGLLPGAGREQQHRDAGGARVGAQRGQQLGAAEPRHHDVAQDEVGRLVPGRGERRGPVADRVHHIPRAQQPGQVLTHVGVVVRDEHPALCRHRPGDLVEPLVRRRPAQRLHDERLGGW